MACLSSDIGYLYNGTPTSAVVFHTVKGDLVASLSQTLCMNGVLQKLKSKIQGGASAPPCICLRAPLTFPRSFIKNLQRESHRESGMESICLILIHVRQWRFYIYGLEGG